MNAPVVQVVSPNVQAGGHERARRALDDLLLRGDKSKDASLLPGDVIYFPPAGALAAVSGSVRNPAIFELKGAASVVSPRWW